MPLTAAHPHLDEIVAVSPVDGAELGRFRVAGAGEVQQAADALRASGKAWGEVPLAERLAAIRKLRRVLAERAEELAGALAREQGKPLTEAFGAEILPGLQALRWLERNAWRVLRPQRMSRFPRRRDLELVPFGVIGALTPWNYPLYLSLTAIAWALAAGNTVLWKPSELAALGAESLHSALREAGLAHAVRMVQGGAPTGEAVVDALCDKYVLIGSAETGRRVLSRLGERLRPVVAELSGVDAFLVLPDADLDLAARSAVWARCVTAGQTCMAPKRILVAEPVYERFLGRAAAHVRSLRAGADIGPLRTPQLHARALAAIDEAVSRGARLLAGGEAVPGPGWYLQPTLLADCRNDMQLFREDVFGPVLAVGSVPDHREALHRLAAGPRMLTASVWTRSGATAAEVLHRLDASVVSVNDVLRPAASPATPFGGSSESGYGRMRGAEGLREMVRTRLVDYGPPAWLPTPHLLPHPPGTLEVLRRVAGIANPGPGRFGRLADLIRAARRFGKDDPE